MITADKVALLINMPVDMLTAGIQKAGYKKDSFKSAKFVGITNGGDFAYSAVYVEEGHECLTKVFVRYDPTTARISVDY